ncbi:hypothetical protein Adt_36924 [Abeliophyllum distichum]|uniref:Uncharacterized protein n=1 Tax=Abeliophyllum distichum TaxID=126358 RepID=A0ABD1QJ82_9LAMI
MGSENTDSQNMLDLYTDPEIMDEVHSSFGRNEEVAKGPLLHSISQPRQIVLMLGAKYTFKYISIFDVDEGEDDTGAVVPPSSLSMVYADILLQAMPPLSTAIALSMTMLTPRVSASKSLFKDVQ